MAPRRHPFWNMQCPVRGPGLTHTQDGGPECTDCGYTPEEWEQTQRRLVDLREAKPEPHLPLPTITGMCMRCRKPVVDHPPVVDQIEPPPIIEPKIATGVPTGKSTIFVRGIEHPAPGRGALTPEWIAWALLQEWRS